MKVVGAGRMPMLAKLALPEAARLLHELLHLTPRL